MSEGWEMSNDNIRMIGTVGQLKCGLMFGSADCWVKLSPDGQIAWHGMSMDEATQKFLTAVRELARRTA
jgi:hypothetical protein